MAEQAAAHRILTTHEFWKALVAAGIFPESDAGQVRRVVLDASADVPGVVMHVERWADERLLDVVLTLDGIEIRGVDK